jgi:Ca2+-binding EF-hand superfamily protein
MMIRPHFEDRAQGNGYRSMWLMSVIAVACTFALVAQAASSERLREIFGQLDTNTDGQVSTVEFENKKIYVFGLRDANDDHMIQPAEVDLDPQQFQSVDKDGDGEISGLEFIEAPIGQFKTYDTDRNGFLTFDELATTASSASSP